MLCVSHEISPLPRGLEISAGALENAKMPSYQTMGAFRIQVGLDLCGLEQLAKLLQARRSGARGVRWHVSRKVGRRCLSLAAGGEGPPSQILGPKNMTKGMFEW